MTKLITTECCCAEHFNDNPATSCCFIHSDWGQRLLVLGATVEVACS